MRDIILVITGGAIGFLSALGTKLIMDRWDRRD